MATFGFQSGVGTTVATGELEDGAVTNAKVNSSAAIAYSKLALTNEIVNADIDDAAAIAYSKLALTNNIVNADIDDAAAIVDTKLATIATAGKVDGAALTGFASIPSGAGVIPSANLPGGVSELATATSAGSSTSLASGTFTAKKYLRILINVVGFASASTLKITFNGDSSALYSYRESTDGGAASDTTANTAIEPFGTGGTYAGPFIVDLDVLCNISSVRKSGFYRLAPLTNANSVPPANLGGGAWTYNSTAAAITSVTLTGSQNLSSGTSIIVLGSST